MDVATTRAMASSTLRYARAALADADGVLAEAASAATATTATSSLGSARASIVHAVSVTPELFTSHGMQQAHDAVVAIDVARRSLDGGGKVATAAQGVGDARQALRYLRLRYSPERIAEQKLQPTPAWVATAADGTSLAPAAKARRAPRRKAPATPKPAEPVTAPAPTIATPTAKPAKPAKLAKPAKPTPVVETPRPAPAVVVEQPKLTPLPELAMPTGKPLPQLEAPKPKPNVEIAIPKPAPTPEISIPKPAPAPEIAIPKPAPAPDIDVPRPANGDDLDVPHFPTASERAEAQRLVTPRRPRPEGEPEPEWSVDRIELPNTSRDKRAKPTTVVVTATAAAAAVAVPISPVGAPVRDVLAELMAVSTLGGDDAVRTRVDRFTSVPELLKIREVGAETAIYVARGVGGQAQGVDDRLTQVTAIRDVDAVIAARIGVLTSQG